MQNKKQTTAKPVQNKKNQSELKYKFLNDSTVAASDTTDGKLFHLLDKKNFYQNW